MTITTAPSKSPRRRGFSLAEVLIAMALISLVFTALLSSWGFIARSTMSIANYSEMNAVGRTGLELFARDVRAARAVEHFSATRITLVQDHEDGPRRVYYEYDPVEKILIRRRGGSQGVVFKNVEEIQFTRYTVLRTPATNDLETKLIQIELRMLRSAQRLDTTKKIVSARYIMRNKRVST